jgi:DNA-binding transcriptional regulator YiaG
MTQAIRGSRPRPPVDPDNTIGQLRSSLGWSQAQLAAWYGVAVLTLHRWEHGAQDPPALALRVARLILDAPNPGQVLRYLGPEA